MGLHKNYDRSFVTISGAVATQGGSLGLSKGTLALVNTANSTADGLQVMDSFLGFPKNQKTLSFRLGIDQKNITRSYSNKSNSSVEFSLEDVVSLKVSAPKITEQKVDEVILGYNGIDDNTSFFFETGGVPKNFSLELKGDAISYMGGNTDVENIDITVEQPRCEPFNDCETCDPCGAVDCKEMTMKVIEQFKKYQLTGGTLVEELVDITPVISCDTAASPTEIPYTYYCLEVCDTGSAGDLAKIQMANPTVTVKRTDRVGAISKYQFIQPQADAAPVDLVLSGNSLIKGCATCPTGSTELVGGEVYSFIVEDDGADLSATIAAYTGADTGAVVVSAVKVEGQSFGKGVYNVIFDLKISNTDIQGFLAADPDNTITVDYVGEAQSLCVFPDLAPIAWSACGTCNVIEEAYVIDLPDNECGNDRLAELQKAYPDLVISLEGTASGCKTRYRTVVISNLVCDECDPIYKDIFVTEAPNNYDTKAWVYDTNNVPTTPSGNCKCGIRFKAKPFTISTGESLRDVLGFVETSVKIRVSGGHPKQVQEGIGVIEQEIFSTEYISKAEPRTHLGGNLQTLEEESRMYFSGRRRNNNFLSRILRGDTSNIEDQLVQYVDYALTVNPSRSSQGFGGTTTENITYHFYAEVGRHMDVESLLNKLATSAGVSTVQAFGA